jgi:hypothetical protein
LRLSVQDIEALIVDVPDFPKPGIVFKDITPLIAHPGGFRGRIPQTGPTAHSVRATRDTALRHRLLDRNPVIHGQSHITFVDANRLSSCGCSIFWPSPNAMQCMAGIASTCLMNFSALRPSHRPLPAPKQCTKEFFDGQSESKKDH